MLSKAMNTLWFGTEAAPVVVVGLRGVTRHCANTLLAAGRTWGEGGRRVVALC